MKERNQKKKRDKSRRKYGLWGASAEGLTDTATGCRVLLLLPRPRLTQAGRVYSDVVTCIRSRSYIRYIA